LGLILKDATVEIQNNVAAASAASSRAAFAKEMMKQRIRIALH